jgi:hypothetical protein
MTTFHRTWLQWWCYALIALGAVFALTVAPSLAGPVALFTDLIFWPVDGRPALDRASALAMSIIGAVMIGWGLLMAALLRHDDLAADPRVLRAMTTAVTVWFVVDSFVSILGGAWLNAVSNTVIYAAFIWPMLASGVLARSASGHTAAR